MPLPDLEGYAASGLTIVVFGPGYGESLMVCDPSGETMIIDSLVDDQNVNPSDVCAGATTNAPAAIMLTHPHEDHAEGFRDLLERRNGNTRIGAVVPLLEPPSRFAVEANPDAAIVGPRQAAKAACTAIQLAWNGGARRWPLIAGTAVEFGATMVEVLHPDADDVRTWLGGPQTNLNRMSTPVEIRWAGQRIVLGAHLDKPGWRRVATRKGPAWSAIDVPGKVPHHGSTGALHRVWIDETRVRADRVLAVAPWDRNKGLPEFGAGRGIDRMLDGVARIHLTSSTAKTPSPVGAAISLAKLNSAIVSQSFDEDVDVVPDSPLGTAHESWVAITLSADGAPPSVTTGTSAVTVTR